MLYNCRVNYEQKQGIRAQWIVAVTAVSLFAIKFIAWYLTRSVAILTDALESIVNVISGFMGLYSLYLSAKPRDKEHPYGHGKVEFISAGIEGTLIVIAGGLIINEAISNLRHPHELGKLDIGMLLIAAAGLVNFLVGSFAVRTGRKNRSLALQASGKHLISDTISTVGILVGLLLIFIFDFQWLDSVVACVFALVIIFQGAKIIRSSVAGIMDESDVALLNAVVSWLQSNRKENWIDLHNLRIIKYGTVIHMDAHLTVPWYFNVHQAHDEVEELHKAVKEKFGDSVELFIHTDGCLDFSCAVCTLSDCAERKQVFREKIDWTVENISTNQKHR